MVLEPFLIILGLAEICPVPSIGTHRSMYQLKSEALSWTKFNNLVAVVVPTLKRFQPPSGSEALTKAARSFGSPRFKLETKTSVMNVCFLTSSGGNPADIIAVASCVVLTFPVGVIFQLAVGIVEAPLANTMVVLAAQMVEVPLASAVVVLVGTISVVRDAA